MIARYVPDPIPEPPEWTYCSCVEFAKWLTGYQGTSFGAARDIEPNIDPSEVQPGDWALLNEGPVGHVAPAMVIGSQSFTTDEANWFISAEALKKLEEYNIEPSAPVEPCLRNSREVRFDYDRLRGFFRPSIYMLELKKTE